MLSKDEIQQLRSLPILSVAERLGLEVDSHHRCLCPFHDEHTPSLVLYPTSNTFFCFACQHHGNVIDLAMKVLGKGFTETCLWLGQGDWYRDPQAERRVSATCPHDPFDATRYLRYFEHPFLNQRASEFLFTQRKLHPQVIEWLRLSSYRDTLQIPYFDTTGRLIGVQFRNLGSTGPRFWFPSGSQCHIYNLPILRHLKDGEDLYIAEGCSDCWALLSSGHKAIAIPSATLLNISELRSQFEHANIRDINIHIYPDADAAGEALYQKLTAVLNITRHSLPSDCKDYSDLYVKYLCK